MHSHAQPWFLLLVIFQILRLQLENEKSAVAKLERSVAAEIRSVQVAAQKSFEEQQEALTRAWELVHSDRAQIDEQRAELQKRSDDLDLKQIMEVERIQKLLEKEKSALASEWAKLKEQQMAAQMQQLMLENQLAGLETSQQKLDALERQRNLYGFSYSCVALSFIEDSLGFCKTSFKI